MHDNENTLILLVGSNPLPNYLSACALRPSRIGFIFSGQTEQAKNRLKSEFKLAMSMDDSRFVEAFVEDPTCATEVRRKIESLFPSDTQMEKVWLNYTGGTKVMAAHARMAYGDRYGMPEFASYLDEGGYKKEPCLRFDSGIPKPLSEYPHGSLTLKTILSLHNLSYSSRTQKEPSPTIEDAREILYGILANHSLSDKLYEQSKRLTGLEKPARAVNEPFEPGKLGLQLSLEKLPDSDKMDTSAFKHWYKFIGGEWLEEWLGEQIRSLNLSPTSEVTVGVNGFRGTRLDKAQLEIDVAVVRGHRSYFVSCTTGRQKDICKSKLFEIAVRSRQLGGDLSRAALVCLADAETVSKLQKDINDMWGASNTTRVFGLPDVITWSTYGDKESNLHSLKEWLES